MGARTMMLIAFGGVTLLLSSCGEVASEPAPPVRDFDASVSTKSGCTTCLDAACARETRACESDLECARTVRCEDDCRARDPTASDCPACPRPLGAVALAFHDDLSACRRRSTTACPACGPPPGPTHRLLTDVCDGVDNFFKGDPATCVRPPEVSESRTRCRTCAISECCESRAACERDAACKRLLECSYCDENSLTFCLDKEPRATRLYGEYHACGVVKCAESCLNDGAVLNPCVACWYDRCADEFIGWRALPEAEVAENCAYDCAGDSACSDACFEAISDTPEFGRFVLCTTARCNDVCAD